LAISKEQVA